MNKEQERYSTTLASWNKAAEVYQDKFMEQDLYNATYDTFCRLVEKTGKTIFEIGCGPGNITRYLLAKRPDFKIEAIDAAPDMVKLARDNNPQAEFRIMDCRNIDVIQAKFDGIVCGFCMPYLSREDCSKLIRDCSGLLNTGGIIYLSAMEGDYAHSGYESGSTGDKMYVYYHEKAHLLKLLETNNFEPADVVTLNFPSGHRSSAHLILIARKTGA